MDHKTLKVDVYSFKTWKREPAIVTIVRPLWSDCTNADYPNKRIALHTNRRYVYIYDTLYYNAIIITHIHEQSYDVQVYGEVYYTIYTVYKYSAVQVCKG